MSEYEGVADTLYIPLTSRINISKRFPDYFYDEKSFELENNIPNTIIAEKSDEYSMLVSVARYYNFDEMTQNFINTHGECNIINLGAGLETAYFRLNRGNSIFYEMDLPHVIDLRRDLLGENEGEILIPGDMFDIKWAESIDKTLPSLILVSGVFQYFHEAEIIKLIKDIQNTFDNAELIFDATTKRGLNFTNRFVKRTGNDSALMYFYIDNAQNFAQKTNTKLIEERMFYTQTRKLLSKKISLITKISMFVCDWRKMAFIIHLKIK